MVKEVSYGYPHGKMSSICLKFNALCDVFNATKGKVSTAYCKPFFFKTNLGAFPTKDQDNNIRNNSTITPLYLIG